MLFYKQFINTTNSNPNKWNYRSVPDVFIIIFFQIFFSNCFIFSFGFLKEEIPAVLYLQFI